MFGPDLAVRDSAMDILLTVTGDVGRSRRCAWTLTDGYLSGVHARFGDRKISDADSKHGTFVNGRRLASGELFALQPGDVLRMGQSLFVVTPDGPRADGGTSHLFGRSPHLAKVDRALALIQSHQVRVLVTGPPGSGKERVARAIQARVAALRGRDEVPMEVVNAAAIPQALVESTLFGTERGAFTGAISSRGLFEAARGGVLFIDEIGEADVGLQAKLLRAVQDGGEFRRVGGRPQAVDAALVFATNRDIDAEVIAGRFREDLLSRIRAVEVSLPGMDERREDILAFVATQLGEPFETPPFDVDVAELILRAGYPGNMRDLVMLAGRIKALHQHLGRTLSVGDISGLRLTPTDATTPVAVAHRPRHAYRDRALFVTAWERHSGRVAAVARELGCDEKTVRTWIGKHGCDPAETPNPRG